jgi:RNA-directed DNA polymerase
VEDKPTEQKPAAVLETAKQAGETSGRWSWVEPAVWTKRMLTALEQGVKGGVWFSLVDKVWKVENLRRGFCQVKANDGAAGADHQTIEAFEQHLEANIEALSREIQQDRYRPSAVRRVWIDKAGSKEKRPLGIPTVRDRVVQAALRNVLEPIFERDFAEHSYGFRPERSAKDALRRVDHLLKSGHGWVVDADLKSYFDSIPHERLMAGVGKKIADSRVLSLIEAFLKQQILEGAERWTPEGGTPQGAVLSPLLANIYLDPLDHQMAGSGFEMVRYADDFVILCRSEAEAGRALGQVQAWVEKVGLTLHPTKTRLVDATQPGGFDFLGYHFERGYRWPRDKSLAKLKATIREKTRRTDGHSLQAIIGQINQTTIGWFEYFKQSHYTTFESIDGWLRMRVRSILRWRSGRKGRGHGADHQRWPNLFFAQHGLFSLAVARAVLVNPRPR